MASHGPHPAGPARSRPRRRDGARGRTAARAVVVAPMLFVPALLLAAACGDGAGGEATAVTGVAVRETDGRYLTATAAVPRLAVRRQPGDERPAWTIPNPDDAGAPLVFGVLDVADGWLQVDLPVPPNGTTGWVRVNDVVLSRHSFRIEVRLAERLLTVFDGDEVVQVEPIAVGPAPAPVDGVFHVDAVLEDDVRLRLDGFGTSAGTAPGSDAAAGSRLTIDGTDDGRVLGGRAPEGCIVLAADGLDRLARTVPLGTPVVVTA